MQTNWSTLEVAIAGVMDSSDSPSGHRFQQPLPSSDINMDVDSVGSGDVEMDMPDSEVEEGSHARKLPFIQTT